MELSSSSLLGVRSTCVRIDQLIVRVCPIYQCLLGLYYTRECNIARICLDRSTKYIIERCVWTVLHTHKSTDYPCLGSNQRWKLACHFQISDFNVTYLEWKNVYEFTIMLLPTQNLRYEFCTYNI